MPTPTLVGVGADNAGTTGSVTYAIPAHQADDVLVAFIETNLTTGITAPSGWAHLTGSPRAQGSNVVSVNVLIRRATGPGHTLTVPASSNHQVGFVAVYRGVRTTGNPWDFTPVGSGATATPSLSATGGTTTEPDCLVLVAAASNLDLGTDHFSNVANAALSSFGEVNQAATANGNGGGIGAWSGIKATTGATGTTTGDQAASGSTSNLVFALVGATAAEPVTGSGAATAQQGTAAGDGTTTATGSGSGTAPAGTASSTGSTGTTGSGAAAAPEAAASGTGQATAAGTGSGTALPGTATGAGATQVDGTGAAAGPEGSATGGGLTTVTGSGGATAPAGTAEGISGNLPTTGSGAATAAVGEATGQGAVQVAGTGVAAGSTAAAGGEATTTVEGTGTAAGPTPDADGTADTTVSGDGAATASPGEATGTGTGDLDSVLDVTIISVVEHTRAYDIVEHSRSYAVLEHPRTTAITDRSRTWTVTEPPPWTITFEEDLMELSRHGRDHYKVTITTDPPVDGPWEASFDDGTTWHPGVADGDAVKWLVAGDRAAQGTAVAVLAPGVTALQPVLRLVDAPEIVVPTSKVPHITIT